MVLAGGKLRSDADEERRRKNSRTTFGPRERTEDEKKVSHSIDKVAPAVAIAYDMQKTPHISSTIGGRKVEHLMANVQALSISLSNEQIKYLERIIPFSPGFPHSLTVN